MSRKSKSVAVKEPVSVDSVIVLGDAKDPLDVELSRLPFFFDKKEKVPFLKATREHLDEMKRMGWEWLTTDRTVNYRMNWDVWFGMREFVQNALDESGNVDIDVDTERKITYIKDTGGGFLTKHLLLGQHKGATPKEVHLSRGCFGEGMKLAALPFFRAGCKVFIRTVGLDITFAMGPFDEYFVHYTFKRPNNNTQGTHIAISNFDGSEYKCRFTPFIPKDKVLLTVKGGPRQHDEGKTRAVYDLPGDLFVRDIFVQNVNGSYDNAYFGYNFWFNSNHEALDPDRNSVRAGDLVTYEFEYILGCKDVEFLTKFFRRISQPDEKNKISDPKWSYEHRVIRGKCLGLNRDQCAAIDAAIKNVFGHGEYTWSTTYEEAKALEHLGIKDLSNKLPNLAAPLHLNKFCKTAQEWIILKDLKTTCEVTSKMVTDNFGEESGKALTSALEVLANISCRYASYGSKVVFFWSIKPSREVDRVGGFYTFSKRQISIKVNQLNSFHNMMTTFIHELGHAMSGGAEDLTEDFEKGTVDAGYSVMEYLTENPDEMKKLKEACKKLSRHNWRELKVDLAKVETDTLPKPEEKKDTVAGAAK